jgi:hypothetical protein
MTGATFHASPARVAAAGVRMVTAIELYEWGPELHGLGEIRAVDECRAAVCSCGAAVFHESRAVVSGFVADHTPGRRDDCTRVEVGPSLDEVRRRFRTPEAEGVLFL